MVSNGALDFQITPKQAQEKIGNLKKAYRAVRQKLNETGTIMLNQQGTKQENNLPILNIMM